MLQEGLKLKEEIRIKKNPFLLTLNNKCSRHWSKIWSRNR